MEKNYIFKKAQEENLSETVKSLKEKNEKMEL